MRLSTLRAKFIKLEVDADGRQSFVPVNKLEDAHGVMMLCPKCYAKNDGIIGTHSVIAWFKGKVADDVTPGPGRWEPTGTKLNDLTLSPSVHLSGGGCGAHFWVRNGQTDGC